MNIQFLADPKFTRKHARLIYSQFFPLYLRVTWFRALLFLGLVFALFQLTRFLSADSGYDWLKSWGLPDSFSAWQWGPVTFVLGLIVVVLIAEWGLRRLIRKEEEQFAIIAPPEQAEFNVTPFEVTMKSDTAAVIVPLHKVSGLALSKSALAIGFSGAGMIIPRSAFETPAAETAFIRAIAKGLQLEALQRSSETVRKLL